MNILCDIGRIFNSFAEFRSESPLKNHPHYKLKVSPAGFREVGNVFCRTRRNLAGCLYFINIHSFPE